jgi:argonaute-like protein implicated in RNA metabolism and viral defense
MWSYKEVLEDPKNAPNSVIEELAMKGKRCFGRMIPIPEPIKAYLVKELNDRNANGVYIFKSFTERKRLRRLNVTLVGTASRLLVN